MLGLALTDIGGRFCPAAKTIGGYVSKMVKLKTQDCKQHTKVLVICIYRAFHIGGFMGQETTSLKILTHHL